jgi:hypothetical protein
MGRSSYRRDFRPPANGYTDRNGSERTGGGGGSEFHSNGGPDADSFTAKDSITEKRSTDIPGMISGLDKKLSGVQQAFTQEIHKISEKENEKFDLIFAILSELQSRQGQLEESLRSLKAQYGSSHMVSNGSQSPQTQFGSSSGSGQFGQMTSQMNGQIGGQMNGNMQFAGVMQGDGAQTMFTAMPQMMIVQSPTNGTMQYNMPQMMTTTGAVVQQMPAQMAMQFVGQSGGPDMGMTYVNGQELMSDTMGKLEKEAEAEDGSTVNGVHDKLSEASEAHLNMHNVNGNSSTSTTWEPEAPSSGDSQHEC